MQPSNNAVAMTTGCSWQPVRPISNPAVAVVRLYIMSYFPCGFWPRIITRFLGDETFGHLADSLYDTSAVRTTHAAAASWRCWQTGLELIVLGKTVALRINECSPDLDVHWSRVYHSARLMVPQEPDFTFTAIDIDGMSVLEIIVPNETVSVDAGGLLCPDVQSAAALMTHAVDRIDTLLEDWYPDIGVRFVQNTKGIYLITRLVPCARCLLATQQVLEGDCDSWSMVRLSQRSGMPDVVQPVHIQSPKSHLSTTVAADRHSRSSSVPVRTGSRDKSTPAESVRSGNRPLHRNRCQLLFSLL